MSTPTPGRRPDVPKKAVAELLPVFLKAIGSHQSPDAEARRLYHDAIIATGRRPGTLRWRAVVHVVSNAAGNRPPENLDEAVQQFIDRKLARRNRALAAADDNADAAIAYITDVRQRTGSGPTWAELTRACGLPTSSAEWFVTRLHNNGTVTSTHERRSLRARTDNTDPSGPARAASRAGNPIGDR